MPFSTSKINLHILYIHFILYYEIEHINFILYSYVHDTDFLRAEIWFPINSYISLALPLMRIMHKWNTKDPS